MNHRQITACKQHAGAARYAYNWGLRRKQEAYQATGTSPSAIDLHRELNVLKQTELPWMYQVSKCAPQEALRHLDRAFAHVFRRYELKRTGKLTGKLGYPRPKMKQQELGCFRLTGSIVIFPDAIQLPRVGRLRLKERGYLPISGTAGVKILSATVAEQAGHWSVSVQVEQEQDVPTNTGPVVGVDLGGKTLATCSDGTVIATPTPLKRRLKKRKGLHRAVSRTHQGSKNRRKAARKLANGYRKVAQQRATTRQQATTRLANTQSVSVIAALHVAGMLRNHRLAQAIGDGGFAELRRPLTDKAAWYGSQVVVVVSRWKPSRKTCSGWGWYHAELTLADRGVVCQNLAHPECRLVLDRDLNAAIHLATIGTLAGSSSERQNTCGVDSAGLSHPALVKLTAVKQETNTGCASA